MAHFVWRNICGIEYFRICILHQQISGIVLNTDSYLHICAKYLELLRYGGIYGDFGVYRSISGDILDENKIGESGYCVLYCKR